MSAKPKTQYQSAGARRYFDRQHWNVCLAKEGYESLADFAPHSDYSAPLLYQFYRGAIPSKETRERLAARLNTDADLLWPIVVTVKK